MFCPKCGATVPDKSGHCPQCGAAVQATPQPAAPAAGTRTPAQGTVYSGYPAQPAPAMALQVDGKATASMILGILSLICFSVLTGIPAIILGHMAKASIRQSRGRLAGDGRATAGLITGYLGSSLFVFLIFAAVAIPALLRPRMVANEKMSLSTVYTLAVNQDTYYKTYPDRGYAASLSRLGPGLPAVDCAVPANRNSDHACLIEAALGCSADTWCAKSGYRYSLTAVCGEGGACSNYVITSAPLNFGTSGTRSFCYSNDQVIRQSFERVKAPLSADECRAWPPATR